MEILAGRKGAFTRSGLHLHVAAMQQRNGTYSRQADAAPHMAGMGANARRLYRNFMTAARG